MQKIHNIMDQITWRREYGMIKIIALDLDDTLLLTDCTIPKETVSVLQKAAKYGVKVVIATGRIYPSAKIYAEEIGTKCPIICYNGAMIRENREGILFSAGLSPALIHQIAVFCKQNDLYLQLYSEDKIVVEKICDKTLADPDSKVTDIIEIGDLTKGELDSSPKMMIFDDPTRLKVVQQELENRFSDQLYIATSKEYLLEMMPKGVSKKNTLKRYAESLGIRREEIMACGDNTNDLEMVEWAGTGVAVANAVPELKTAADYISSEERSYGVAEAVRNLVLKEYRGMKKDL